MFKRKETGYKKCPRCGNKCLAHQSKCEECGLVFSRLQFASNKAAKRKIRKFDRDFIIYTNQFPKDVSYIKLLLFTIFFGIMGVQYYYVGKYIKGLLMSTSFVYLIFATIFNAQIIASIDPTYAYLPVGIAAFSWIVSIVYVVFRKFKVPVIVEMPTVDVDYKKKKKEILEDAEELKKETANLKNKETKITKKEDKKNSLVAESLKETEPLQKKRKLSKGDEKK